MVFSSSLGRAFARRNAASRLISHSRLNGAFALSEDLARFSAYQLGDLGNDLIVPSDRSPKLGRDCVDLVAANPSSASTAARSQSSCCSVVIEIGATRASTLASSTVSSAVAEYAMDSLGGWIGR
jgi:hypothetical protein